jgi:hypothetical protein
MAGTWADLLWGLTPLDTERVGFLKAFALRWVVNQQAIAAIPFDRCVTGRLGTTQEYPFPYMSVIPASGRQQYRSDRSENLRRIISVHVWVDPAKLEEGEEIAELVRRVWANQAWKYNYGKVIDVLDGGLNTHELTDPAFRAWELVRLLTVCYEQSRVDTPFCPQASQSSEDWARSSSSSGVPSSITSQVSPRKRKFRGTTKEKRSIIQ